jgi:predicted signal transduction protein with EAL and GGDEF domain
VKYISGGEATDCERQQLIVTASFGVTTAGLGQTDENTLVRAADLALYRAKNSGRKCVCAATLDAAINDLLSLHGLLSGGENRVRTNESN